MITSQRRGAARRSLAVVAAALLGLVGLVIPASAGAADPGWTTTVDITAASEATGLKADVHGTDYTGLPNSSIGSPAVGVYAGLWDPADSLADIEADNSLIIGAEFQYGAGTTNPNWTIPLDIPAADLDPDVDYDVIVWAAHGIPTADTVLDAIPLGLTVAQKQALFPGWTPPAWSTSVDVTAASEATGLKADVHGTDYTGLPNSSIGSPAVGVYAGLWDPADSLADIEADNSLIIGAEFLYGAGVTSPDWIIGLDIPAAELDPDVDYDVIVWAAHGVPNAQTVLDSVPLGLTPAQKAALFPGTGPTTTTTTTTVPPSTDPWSTTVNVTAATAADGLKLRVRGTGYTNLPRSSTGAPSMGVYAALRDPATMSNAAISADQDIVPAVMYVPTAQISGGSWTTTLSAAASDLDPAANYEVIVWVAHGEITPTTLLDTVPVNLTAAQKNALFPGGNPPPATTTPPTTRPGATTPTTQRPTPHAPTRNTGVNEQGLYCVTETIAGTAGTPQLHWGVRSSFVNYIEGGIAKGSVDTGGGVTRSGDAFTWAHGSGEVSTAGRGTWSFTGFVHFSGHNDVLNTTIANPQVRVNGSTGELIADVQSQDMEGNDASGDGMVIAELRFASVSPSGGTASAALTADGARALNSMYEPGEAMDPVTVSVSGGTAGTSVENCYDADGNLVSSTPIGGSADGSGQLATTGFGAWRLAAAGMTMVLIGMLALTVTTRRRRVHLPVK